MSIVSDVTRSLLEKESAFAYFYDSLQEFELPGLAEPLEAELFWLKGKINVYEMLQDKLYERLVRRYHQCFTTQCYTELGLNRDQMPNINHPDWALVDHYHVGVAYATYVMLRIIQYYDYKELSTQFISDYFTQNESWFNVHRQKIHIINRQISEMPEISKALSKDYDYTQKPTDDVYSFVETKLLLLKQYTNNSPTWRDKDNKVVSEENQKLRDKIQLLENEIKELKKYLNEYEKGPIVINPHDKVRLELLCKLLPPEVDENIYGNKAEIARLFEYISGLPFQTCKNYMTNKDLNVNEHKDEITQVNIRLNKLGVKFLIE